MALYRDVAVRWVLPINVVTVFCRVGFKLDRGVLVYRQNVPSIDVPMSIAPRLCVFFPELRERRVEGIRASVEIGVRFAVRSFLSSFDHCRGSAVYTREAVGNKAYYIFRRFG